MLSALTAGGSPVAKFNPSEAVLADNQQAKFNPSEAILADSPHQNWLMKAADVVNDAGKGTDASLINTLSTLTGGLTPRYDPTGNKTAINVGKIAGSLLPGGVAEKGAALGLSGLERLPAIAKTALASSAGGAAGSLGVDANPLEGAAIGGGLGSVLHLAANAKPLVKEGLRKLLVGSGKNVTPEEFKAARDAVPDGIEAPIGELADSPKAKGSYDLSKAVVFSGADKPYQQLFNHLNQGVKGLVDDAPISNNPNEIVYNDLSNKYSALKGNTEALYNDLTNSADDAKTPFNRSSYDNYLNSATDEIGKKIERGDTARNRYSPTLSKLNELKKDRVGSFSDAQAQKADLGDLISKSKFDDSKKYDVRLLQGAKDSLERSLKDSAETEPTLYQKYLDANNARIEQGKMERLNLKDDSPFYKIHQKKGTPDNLIGSYLRTSNKGSDYSNLLSNLTDHLSPESKSIVAKTYLDPKDDGKLGKILTKLGKLSPNQRGLLFGDKADAANQLDSLSKLYPQSKSADFTPKTGFTGGKVTQAVLEGGGALGGAFSGHPVSALTAAAAPSLLAQATQRALRSEWLKNEYARHLAGIARRPQAPNPILNNLVRQPAIATQGGNNG